MSPRTIDKTHVVPPPDLEGDELREILLAQRASYLVEGIPSRETRLDRIHRFTLAILERADDIVEALNADFGNRSELASLGCDVVSIVGEVEQVRNKLEEWMADQEVPGSAEAGLPTFIQSRPKGVVGVVGPWNFPVTLVAVPTIEALGAGNRVMIKMSEIPWRTAELIAEAVASRMSSDEVVVIRGGVETSTAFSDLPLDHLIFTGSPQVGARVAQAAAANLVPVTLELGGKNPVVLGLDADVAEAARRTAGMRMLNGGQVCLCPDYVFVPRQYLDEFVREFESTVREYFPQYVNHPSVVSIINDKNFDRVLSLIQDAEGKGARVVRIVPDGEEELLPNRELRRIAPTVLLDVTEDMDVAHEEIFGPVIAVWPYDSLDDVISYVNTRPSPLAAYWFGGDGPEFRVFLDRTTSGGVTRNDIGAHWTVDGAPSGGVGRSGMGAYSGKIGFDTFSHQRTVAASTRPVGSAASFLAPAAGLDATLLRGYIEEARAGIQQRLDGR